MKEVTIIGAGLVGSLLSVYLAKRGHQVRVYERRPDMRKADIAGGRSINLALSDRGWRALEKVGLDKEVRPISIPMTGRLIHAIDGSLSLQAYGKEGQAIYSVSRGELNRIMVDSTENLPNIDFYFNEKCVRIERKSNRLHLLNTETRENKVLQPDLIFGGDGAFSSVRSAMQRIDRFNYTQEFLPHAYKELCIPATAAGGWQIEKNALHIWPRKSFMLIALPNMDGSFTCTLFLAFEGAVSFEQLQDEQAVQAFFETYFPDVLPLMPNLIEDFFENPTGSLVTIRCNPWTYEGRMALIGDASHAIVPFYGQGMNAGFEDCRVLGEIIDKNTDKKGQTDWDMVFAQYEDSRIPDADAIADLALRNFVEMRDSVINPQFLLRKKIEKQLQQRYPERYLPLYSMVTFSHLRYSEALRIGRAQDRLFEQLLALENVEQKWDNGELDAIIETWMRKNNI